MDSVNSRNPKCDPLLTEYLQKEALNSLPTVGIVLTNLRVSAGQAISARNSVTP